MHVIYVSDSHILWRYPMSHLSSQPPEIAAENLSQSPRSAGSAWAREKRFADVLGRRMAYIERGVGHPIVFLQDRKSTRLNSSHTVISYAVFCLKKKKN